MAEVRYPVSKSVGDGSLAQELKNLRANYQANYLDSDPVVYAHRFKQPADQEVSAFLAAILAFGSVKAIFKTLNRLFEVLGPHPADFLARLNPGKWLKADCPLPRHRWVSPQDLQLALATISSIVKREGSLKNLFLREYHPEEADLEMPLIYFTQELLVRAENLSGRTPTRGLAFLFSGPQKGGTAKRMNLFLRWMVRAEAPDLGLWASEISTKQLLIPLDTHLSRVSRYLGFTHRKNDCWKTVKEVTERFRELEPDDPTSFDFALTRLGILDRCLHRPDPKICPACTLVLHCKLGRQVA